MINKYAKINLLIKTLFYLSFKITIFKKYNLFTKNAHFDIYVLIIFIYTFFYNNKIT